MGKDLIQKAIRGNIGAFGEIIKKYQELVHAKALQITRDPIGAQDVTQDIAANTGNALGLLASLAMPGGGVNTIRQAREWQALQEHLAWAGQFCQE